MKSRTVCTYLRRKAAKVRGEKMEERSAWLKFEIAEPPEDITADAVSGLARRTPTDEHPEDPKSSETGEDPLGSKPIGQRMSKAVLGVRASLDLLRAHVIEQNMAQVYRATADRTEVDPEAVFHPHRFTASPRKEDR